MFYILDFAYLLMLCSQT